MLRSESVAQAVSQLGVELTSLWLVFQEEVNAESRISLREAQERYASGAKVLWETFHDEISRIF